MITIRIFLFYFLLTLSFASISTAQSIDVHNLLGKSQKEVIKKYGNPVHKDNSNPSMQCMFYKNNTSTMIFVADKKGVYQVEATKSFDTESEARSNIDSFISNSITDGFNVDTVSTSDFQLKRKGAKIDLQIYENKLSKNFEIRVKGNKTES
jgi:hypothetical protein